MSKTPMRADLWAEHQARMDKLTATLRKLPGWAATVQEIQVYGPPGRVNVIATSRTRQAAEVMRRALVEMKAQTGVFSRVSALESTDLARNNTGTCLLPTRVAVYRVYAYP